MARKYTCQACGGAGHGRDDCGKSRIPEPALAAALATQNSETVSQPSHESTYELFRKASPEPPLTVRQGAALPGTAYSGMRVEFRNPTTGDVRVEWSGEMHGRWETDVDPASEALAGLNGTTDGYLPYRAVLSAPHPDLPGAWAERDVILLDGEVRRIAERVHYREQQKREWAAAKKAPETINGGAVVPGTAYSRIEVFYRQVGTGKLAKKTFNKSGVWQGNNDPATDILGDGQLVRPDIEGFYPYRAVLVYSNPESPQDSVEYSVPFDKDTQERISERARQRSVERIGRQREIKAHSFPASELRKSMKVRLEDGRSITIDRISISSYSHNWSIYGKDDAGNEVSGSIDSRKPVYVVNRTRG